MKKMVLCGILALCLLVLAGCGGSDGNSSTGNNGSAKEIKEIPVILNQAEYIFCQNFFLNGYASQYIGKKAEKEGVYTVVLDEKGKERHYLWGYLDNTQCCDWAWEFVPANPEALPAVGSRIRISGNYAEASGALDGYWIANAQVETLENYTGEQRDLNMSAMCDMLERVQLARVVRYPDIYEGKTYFAYGRVAATDMIQDPYYDNSWTALVETEETLPAIGTTVVLSGTVKGGVLADAKIIKTLD